MRLITISAISALAFAGCNPSTPASDGAESADTSAAMAGHDMKAMDDSMKSADAADDTATVETPDGYTYHTYPAKVESIHLPTAAGDVWTATPSDPVMVEIGEAKDETMPDGALHHVVKVTPKSAGNVAVKFERRASADMAGPVTETRTVNFMIH